MRPPFQRQLGRWGGRACRLPATRTRCGPSGRTASPARPTDLSSPPSGTWCSSSRRRFGGSGGGTQWRGGAPPHTPPSPPPSQDAYTPLHSAAVTLCDAALADARGGPAFTEMAKGFFAGLPPERLARVCVGFRHLAPAPGAAAAPLPGPPSRAPSGALAVVPGDPAGSDLGLPPPPPLGTDAEAAGPRPYEPQSQALPPPTPPAGAGGGGAGGAVLAWAGAVLGPTVDSALGRAAHVAFLESESVAALVALGLRRLWE